MDLAKDPPCKGIFGKIHYGHRLPNLILKFDAPLVLVLVLNAVVLVIVEPFGFSSTSTGTSTGIRLSTSTMNNPSKRPRFTQIE